jgi:hypothetical protein
MESYYGLMVVGIVLTIGGIIGICLDISNIYTGLMTIIFGVVISGIGILLKLRNKTSEVK